MFKVCFWAVGARSSLACVREAVLWRNFSPSSSSPLALLHHPTLSVLPSLLSPSSFLCFSARKSKSQHDTSLDPILAQICWVWGPQLFLDLHFFLNAAKWNHAFLCPSQHAEQQLHKSPRVIFSQLIALHVDFVFSILFSYRVSVCGGGGTWHTHTQHKKEETPPTSLSVAIWPASGECVLHVRYLYNVLKTQK